MRKSRPGITHRKLMTLLVLGHLFAVSAHADKASRTERHDGPEESRPTLRRPQIGSEMSVTDQFALKAAYKGAIKRLARDESCRALFDELYLDARHAMALGHYQPAQSAAEKARCAPGVAAATGVGRTRIVLCQHFNTLPRRTKTAILIHEALHTAGLDEAPHDPAGRTSREITEMVEEACSL